MDSRFIANITPRPTLNACGDGNPVHLHCPDPEALEPLARALAAVVRPGDVMLLHGPLGAGKTTFTQILARALGVGEDQYVSSPSFALLHEYQGRLPLAHMDLYRLADEEEVEEAGLLDALAEDRLCLIEWPQRLGSLTPAARLDIYLEPVAAGGRDVILVSHGDDWLQRLAQLAAQLQPMADRNPGQEPFTKTL